MTCTRPAPATDPANAARLPRAVVVIGLVSLLNDFASEMVTPLIPKGAREKRLNLLNNVPLFPGPGG